VNGQAVQGLASSMDGYVQKAFTVVAKRIDFQRSGGIM